MIDRLKIEGFKSLLDVEIELGAVNVFIGANSSGKSNLLESLGVIGAAAFGAIEFETLRYRGVRTGLPYLYASAFKRGERKGPIIFEVKSQTSTYRLAVSVDEKRPLERWNISREFLESEGRPILVRDPGDSKIYDDKGQGESVEAQGDQSLAKLALARLGANRSAHSLIQELESFALYSSNSLALRGVLPSGDVTRDPVGLSGSGLAAAVGELIGDKKGLLGPFDMDDVLELIDWASEISFLSVPENQSLAGSSPARKVLIFQDKYLRSAHNLLSTLEVSDGTLHILFLLVLASHPRAPRILALENFDSCLHPRLAAALTRLVSHRIVEDGTRQILATTHNPLVLDGLDLKDDRVRLFAVDRDSDGVTRVQRVEISSQLLAEAERGLTLSRLWLMGRLGGVPAAL